MTNRPLHDTHERLRSVETKLHYLEKRQQDIETLLNNHNNQLMRVTDSLSDDLTAMESTLADFKEDYDEISHKYAQFTRLPGWVKVTVVLLLVIYAPIILLLLLRSFM